jgi:alpha-glucosidase
VLGNHDQSRIASRIGRERARLAQMLLLCLRGTPTCYYGDEIGMQDVLVPPELTQDPQGKFSYPHSRDPERSPMQWEAVPQAGFSTAQPWLPVGEDYESVNVEAQRAEPRSTLCLFRRLAWLRRERAALAYGTYRSLHPRPGDHGEPLSTTRDRVFAFARETGREHLAVLLNFSPDRVTVDLSDLGAHGRVLLSSELDREGGLPLANVELRPYEGLIVETV